MLGCLDMRSSGYFHVSRDTLQIMKSSFRDNCSFLSEDESTEYFDLYNKDHNEVVNYIKTEVNKRLKQQGNTKLVDRNQHPVENDTNIVPDKYEDPYPWLDKEDPRRNMTDQEILRICRSIRFRFKYSREEKLIQSNVKIQRSIFS